MSFKSRKDNRTEDRTSASEMHHASGHTDLAAILGDHTLNAEREAVTVAPKGYRARSIAKTAPRR